MKLEGSYDVPAPRAKVWDVFLNPKQLRKAIPGCEKLEALGDDEYKATLKIGVAAVKGTFEGKVRLLDKKQPDSYRLVAEGSGGPGFVKADTLITLTETDGGSGPRSGTPTRTARSTGRSSRRRASRPTRSGPSTTSARFRSRPRTS